MAVGEITTWATVENHRCNSMVRQLLNMHIIYWDSNLTP